MTEIFEPSAIDAADTRSLARLQANRRSCRAFLSQAVPAAILHRVFQQAQMAASWCNAQPWQVIVTSGEGTERFRERLYEVASSDARRATAPEPRPAEYRRSDLPMPKEYTGVYQQRRRTAGTQLYAAMGIMGDRVRSAKYTLENFRMFNAPHTAIITSARELGVYGAIDTGGYIANLMLVLESLGIASIAQAALAAYSDVIRDFFSLDADRIVVCGVSFGYADTAHAANRFRTARAPLDEVVTWYGSSA